MSFKDIMHIKYPAQYCCPVRAFSFFLSPALHTRRLTFMNCINWVSLSSVLANVIASRKSKSSKRERSSPSSLPARLQFCSFNWGAASSWWPISCSHRPYQVPMTTLTSWSGRSYLASWYFGGSLHFTIPLKKVSSLNYLCLPFWMFHVFPTGILTDTLMLAPFQEKHQS